MKRTFIIVLHERKISIVKLVAGYGPETHVIPRFVHSFVCHLDLVGRLTCLPATSRSNDYHFASDAPIIEFIGPIIVHRRSGRLKVGLHRPTPRQKQQERECNQHKKESKYVSTHRTVWGEEDDSLVRMTPKCRASSSHASDHVRPVGFASDCRHHRIQPSSP